MPKNKYTSKQMKIARVAEPRDEITGADFEAMNNSKMGGGMVKYAEGGDVREEQLKQLLEDAREKGDDDMVLEIMGDLKQMGAEGFMGGGMVKPRGYRYGGKVKGYRDMRWAVEIEACPEGFNTGESGCLLTLFTQ